LGLLNQVIDGATDIVQALCGNFYQARRAPTLALVGSIVSQADKTLLSQPLRI
jgi:hypothetical protein